MQELEIVDMSCSIEVVEAEYVLQQRSQQSQRLQLIRYLYNNPVLMMLLPALIIFMSWPLAGCGAASAGNQQPDIDAAALAGTKCRFPWQVGVFYQADLARLLDVGACINSEDRLISYVPPLDGTRPIIDTLCQENYAMKFVFFDLQLVELKKVDPVGGSFQAEFQMIVHWLDYVDEFSNATDVDGTRSFLCDNNPQSQACCDNVWVPPFV